MVGEADPPHAASDAGDLGCEEVDAVAVKVAAGAVVVLGGAGIGVAGEIWASRRGTPASKALVITAWRSECGLMWRDGGGLRDPGDHPARVATVDRCPRPVAG